MAKTPVLGVVFGEKMRSWTVIGEHLLTAPIGLGYSDSLSDYSVPPPANCDDTSTLLVFANTHPTKNFTPLSLPSSMDLPTR